MRQLMASLIIGTSCTLAAPSVQAGDFSVGVQIVAGEPMQHVWVEPVYEMRVERVYREPVVQERIERVFVADRFETRSVQLLDSCGRTVYRNETVLVEPAHWQDVRQQVVVRPGFYEDVAQQVCVREGYWQYAPADGGPVIYAPPVVVVPEPVHVGPRFDAYFEYSNRRAHEYRHHRQDDDRRDNHRKEHFVGSDRNVDDRTGDSYRRAYDPKFEQRASSRDRDQQRDSQDRARSEGGRNSDRNTDRNTDRSERSRR
jgi:hypothetical protein